MPGMVEIICLANSRKLQGRCIAGLKTDGSGWLRPVAAGKDGTLRPADCRLQDGSEPLLLDVIHLGCASPAPQPHQPENHRIDRTNWRLAVRPAPDPVQEILNSHLVKGPLLLENFGDKRDFGPLRLNPVAASLALIAPQNLLWHIKTSFRGNRQTKANFHLTHTPYSLSITDPVWVQRLAHLPLGLHPLSAAGVSADTQLLFTISLSEPVEWNNHCYKLVAGVIVMPHQEKINDTLEAKSKQQ